MTVKKGKEMACGNCSKVIYKLPSEIKGSKSGKVFCSTSCSAIYSNSHTGIFHAKHCSNCTKTKNKISDSLKEFYLKNPKKLKKYYCKICNKEAPRSGKKPRRVCSKECFDIARKLAGSKGGGKTASSPFCQRNRSKNERLFYDKIKEIYPDALNNERIFNSYDADVIIPSLKIAIHWNGPWHYKVIFSEKHLKSIEKRDTSRYAEIEKCGYKNYIIKDLTHKPDKNKVMNEIDLFIKSICSVTEVGGLG